MSLLAGINYDPETAVWEYMNVASAMTALDPALQLTFTVPASGNVLVRMVGNIKGASAHGSIFFGVIDNATGAVLARVRPGNSGYAGNTNALNGYEAVFTVTGLTPAATVTWDAAYGVEYPVTSCWLGYGGPNDATSNNAFGAFQYEVWTA